MSQQTPTIAVVHTSSVSVPVYEPLFAAHAPDVRIENVVDEGMLSCVVDAGEVTGELRARLLETFERAEQSGADLLFSACSSVGEVADVAAERARVPLVKVDEAMAREACEACRGGGRVGVLATLPTTLGPTSRLILKTADAVGAELEVATHLVEGAFERLSQGDRASHDALVRAAVVDFASGVDVVVCAQGSTADALTEVTSLPVPVLSSPASGVARAVAVLRQTLMGG